MCSIEAHKYSERHFVIFVKSLIFEFIRILIFVLFSIISRRKGSLNMLALCSDVSLPHMKYISHLYSSLDVALIRLFVKYKLSQFGSIFHHRTRLFACVERTKVSNSSYSRDPRMRLFPAFSSLVHIERKIKQYFRGKFTQDFTSPWPIVSFC
jgi:hypothetical protein